MEGTKVVTHKFVLDTGGCGTNVVIIILTAFLFLPAAGAQRPFTIKVDTQLVVETVVVKDKDGKNIEGLT